MSIYYFTASESQEFWSSISWWFWLRFSHEVAIKDVTEGCGHLKVWLERKHHIPWCLTHGCWWKALVPWHVAFSLEVTWVSSQHGSWLPSLGASYPRKGQSRSYNAFYVLTTAITHCHIHGVLGYTAQPYSVRAGTTQGIKTRRQWVFFEDNLKKWLPQPFWFDCIELDSIAAGQYNFWHLLLISSEVDICLLFLNHWINTIANFF